MTPRIAEIINCDACPHFDNYYYDYREYCSLLDRKLGHVYSSDFKYLYPIPDDCPLPTKE